MRLYRLTYLPLATSHGNILKPIVISRPLLGPAFRAFLLLLWFDLDSISYSGFIEMSIREKSVSRN